MCLSIAWGELAKEAPPAEEAVADEAAARAPAAAVFCLIKVANSLSAAANSAVADLMFFWYMAIATKTQYELFWGAKANHERKKATDLRHQGIRTSPLLLCRLGLVGTVIQYFELILETLAFPSQLFNRQSRTGFRINHRAVCCLL